MARKPGTHRWYARVWLGIGSIIGTLVLVSPARAQNFDSALSEAAEGIAEAIEQADKQRVAVIDFDQIEGQVTALGRFLAEEISANLAGSPRAFKVIDRANLQSILAEHALSMSGLVNPENAKRLGQIAGVDALVLGTYTDFGESYRLSLKAIATDTAEMVATARTNVPKTNALVQLAARPLEQRELTPQTAGVAERSPEAPTATSTEASEPNVLYESGVERGGFEGWSLGPAWKRLNATLVNDGTERGLAVAPYRPESTDYLIEAEIRVVGDGAGYTNSFGIVVRAKGEEGYAIGVWTDRVSTKQKTTMCYLEEEMGRGGGCGHEGNPYRPGTEWHTYRIAVQGNTIILMVDDSSLASLADNRFLSAGQVGLWSKGYQLEVRSFKVLSLGR